MSTPRAAKERKTIAIKLQDGQPLNRLELQYDLLHHIFSNDKPVFTDPNQTINHQPPRTKVTFRDLYLNTLIRSPKCSRGPREKALENPEFGTEFAKIALLTNAGRINTTMAFFPEMRTALRTYHPVPSLQKTDGNLQDAPRIKNILKDCHLPTEDKGLPPPSPSEILSRLTSHQVPPTTIVNLLFSVTHPSYSAIVARTHFDPSLVMEWADIFVPATFSSASRAQAFLWLCYHYLESSNNGNPFADEYSKKHPGKAPSLVRLTPEEMTRENVDTPEEIAWGLEMMARRQEFLAKIKEESEVKVKDKEREKEREKERGIGSIGNRSPGRRDSAKLPSRSRTTRDGTIPPPTPMSRISVIDSDMAIEDNNTSSVLKPFNATNSSRLSASPSAFALRHHSSDIKPGTAALPQSPQPYVPRPVSYALPPPGWPKRSLLDNAFQLALTTDPLADSGEEDEGARCDYILRLHVVNRLRGRQPTPELDDGVASTPPIEVAAEHNLKEVRTAGGEASKVTK